MFGTTDVVLEPTGETVLSHAAAGILIHAHSVSEGALTKIVAANDGVAFVFGVGKDREQKGSKNGNDRDNHKQLNEREAAVPGVHRSM